MSSIDSSPAVALDRPVDLPLSISIITLNEQRNIKRCLESVAGLGREIIVVDSGSSDRTAEIAAHYGATFIHNDWPGHVAQKNVALSHCSQPWVLSLDADEALDDRLRQQVIDTVTADGPKPGYEVNRLTWFLGDWVRHAWHPEWRLRLVKREGAEWKGTDPHDYLTIKGGTGRLDGFLLHYSFTDLAHHANKTVDYGGISGRAMIAKGKRPTVGNLIGSPLWRFFKVLILKGGWRDGWRGVLIAYTTMMAGVLKYAFAMEAQRVESSKKTRDETDDKDKQS